MKTEEVVHIIMTFYLRTAVQNLRTCTHKVYGRKNTACFTQHALCARHLQCVISACRFFKIFKYWATYSQPVLYERSWRRTWRTMGNELWLLYGLWLGR